MTARLEPRWRSVAPPATGRVPYAMRYWVLCQGSLTARVVRHCGSGRFRVHVLGQAWGRALPSERRLLELRGGERVLVREVELRCNEVPWVFARTVIPALTLNGPLRRLSSLGNRPLGQLLFSDPRVERGPSEAARIEPHHGLFPARNGPNGSTPLWGRRTLFRLAGRPLLVNEVFLTAITEP